MNLDCPERLEAASPELWPETVPGVSGFARCLQGPASVGSGLSSRFRTELGAEDIRLVNELGQLSADSLVEHIKALQGNAYQLGVEEAKQLSRGKFLQVN